MNLLKIILQAWVSGNFLFNFLQAIIEDQQILNHLVMQLTGQVFSLLLAFGQQAPMGILEGHVSNASNDDSPVGGAFIRVVESNQTIISNAAGDYSGGVMEGTYTVRAEHESFETVTVEDVEILENETTRLDFSLTDIRGPYISGTTELPLTAPGDRLSMTGAGTSCWSSRLRQMPPCPLA